MRLLVTGGCGFIGTNFVYRMLARHDDIFILNLDLLTYAGNPLNVKPLKDDPRHLLVKGDIRDAELVPQLLEEHRIDAVVNFAAESHVDRSIHDSAPFLSTNVMGTHNMLQAALKVGVERFVHVSTDEVYGTLGPEGKFSETTPLAPNSPYSASKASADLVCRAWVETYDFPVVITRCSNNYGPYQFPEKLIPLMYLKAKAGEPLPVYGDGMNVRDWIHVDDHNAGVELALLKGNPGGIYNLGGNAERPNIEVVKAILKRAGQPEDLISFVTDRPGHDRRYAMDYSLAQRELGFEPTMTFEQGLDKTITWYEENAAWLEKVQSGAYRDFMADWYKER